MVADTAVRDGKPPNAPQPGSSPASPYAPQWPARHWSAHPKVLPGRGDRKQVTVPAARGPAALPCRTDCTKLHRPGQGQEGWEVDSAFLCSLQKAVTMCIQGLGGPESCTYRANPSAATGHPPVPPWRTISWPGRSRGSNTRVGSCERTTRARGEGRVLAGQGCIGLSCVTGVGASKLKPDPQACPALPAHIL